VKATLLAAVLVLAAASASAQTIYSKVSLDGHKTFSDRPDTTPELAEEEAPALTERSGRARLSPLSSRRGAEIDAKEATRRLAQALRKQRQGLAPLAGEQAQGSEDNVASRRYRQRQERLRVAVEQAQQRVNETLRTQLTRR
jgi:hypothetical protein